RHTRSKRDWSSDVCSSDLQPALAELERIRIVCDRPAVQAQGAFDQFVEHVALRHRVVIVPCLCLGSQGFGSRSGFGTAGQVLDKIGRASCRERVWMWGVEG